MTPEKLELLEEGKFELNRYFTKEGKSPFEYDIYGNPIKWIAEDVKVSDDLGKTIYTQPAVKRPEFWSSLAIKVVASKYFWGDQAKGERENSVEMLISRVADFFERQSFLQRYFDAEKAKILRDEIAAICLNQICVFNSPVWFNVGINSYNPEAGGVSAYKWDATTESVVAVKKSDDSPQCSACFILSIEDDMDSIMKVQVAEATLFKAGSGTGTNRSPLRSTREKITGGGRASGPVSFMKGYDAYANIIKSGGKTRRAAKMEILNVDHPDIMDFIEAKQKEEKKAWALIEQGYAGGMNGEAYGSIFFQNCNMSVRVPDEFMLAVKNNSEWQTKYVLTGKVCETFKAREMIKKIAEGTWICGDPGIQCDSIIQKYHTCKNSGRINATNPCSEFVFLDDTACNLASINLMKFLTQEGNFDVESFKEVVRKFIIAMEIIVDGASYPTPEIAERSHMFRPLGLGYANLGALLMSLGLPYDSDEGRAVSAAITAIMCGEAYKTSAELAALVGPFPAFAKNKEPMMEVINLHRENVKKIDVNKVPSHLRYLVNEAWDCWTDAIELGEKYGFRNAQVSVLAPTGTISFMLDCDTTGIEPDIALVKYKVLSGGGMLKIMNRAVPVALKNLGYKEKEISDIVNYIDKNDTIEGAPWLREEHLTVFDCAFRPAKGKRAIHYKGHIKMMAVCQPFISGAISKTINMPEESSVDDIFDAYVYAWEQGLKAVAIYRENSKRSQPLNTQKTEGEIIKKKGAQIVSEIVKFQERRKLPQTRKSITHKFDIAGHEGYLTVGLYDDGKPGEIFVTMSKVGSTINGLVDAWATSISMNLQYGVPVEVLFNKFRHQKFEPSGFVRNTNGGEIDSRRAMIRTASSIVDYVAQFMLNNFGTGAEKVDVEIKPPDISLISETQTQLAVSENKKDEKLIIDFGNEGLICPHCGGPAKRIGNCAIYCTSCKQTTRSGCGE
jgi:ribonucleoside-diphosphate reductase alpha chain